MKQKGMIIAEKKTPTGTVKLIQTGASEFRVTKDWNGNHTSKFTFKSLEFAQPFFNNLSKK